MTLQHTDKPRYILTANELSKLSDISEAVLLKRFENSALVKLGPLKTGIKASHVRTFLSQHQVDYSFRVIAHINLKGGVGKTTSTITMATRAAQYGYKTCVLDLDSQGSASLAFGIVPQDDDPVFIDVWQQPDELLMASLVDIQDGLALLPSSLENGLLDVSLNNPTQQKNAVSQVCATLQNNGFDLVFIDCPPSLGAAVIASACAADTIVIPVGFDVFSLKGLTLTVAEISAIRDTFGLPAATIKILYALLDRRVKQSIETLEHLQINYPEQLLSTAIRTSTEFNKAVNKQATVYSTSARNHAKDDYDQCLRELLNFAPQFKTGER